MRYGSITDIILLLCGVNITSAHIAARPGGLWVNAAGLLFIILLGIEGRWICMNRRLVALKDFGSSRENRRILND